MWPDCNTNCVPNIFYTDIRAVGSSHILSHNCAFRLTSNVDAYRAAYGNPNNNTNPIANLVPNLQ
jgi:hypothetical protein